MVALKATKAEISQKDCVGSDRFTVCPALGSVACWKTGIQRCESVLPLTWGNLTPLLREVKFINACPLIMKIDIVQLN